MNNRWILQDICDIWCIYFGILTLQISSVTSCTRFDFTKFFILPTQCMSVFCMDNNNTPLFSCTVLTYFYTENECVYCAVRTKSLKVIQINLILQIGAPWHWPLTSEARFQSWSRQCAVCSRVATGHSVSENVGFFPVTATQPTFHTDLQLSTALIIQTSNRSLATLK